VKADAEGPETDDPVIDAELDVDAMTVIAELG